MNPRAFTLLLIALGGALGSLTRYGLSLWINGKNITATWPWGTFIVNLIGCLIIGLLGGYWSKNSTSIEWRLFLITGFLGGFTTFSSFAIESLTLFQTKPLIMLSYVITSTLLGISLAGFGFFIGSR